MLTHPVVVHEPVVPLKVVNRTRNLTPSFAARVASGGVTPRAVALGQYVDVPSGCHDPAAPVVRFLYWNSQAACRYFASVGVPFTTV